MNWIIQHSQLMPFHTHLDQSLQPILDDIGSFQWLVSDLDYMGAGEDYPVNLDDDYFLLSPEDFEKMINSYAQVIWGVIIALPGGKSINIDEKNIPLAEGNPSIWKNARLQHPDAIIEITCFDSSYTIVKFSDQDLSDKFKLYFGDEAIDLEAFS